MKLTALTVFAAVASIAPAMALPLAPVAPSEHIARVQLRCDENSCIDQRSGRYTQSGCDRRGCYPISGAVGQLGPNGEDYRYGRRYDRGPRGNAYGYYGRRGRDWYDD